MMSNTALHSVLLREPGWASSFDDSASAEIVKTVDSSSQNWDCKSKP